MCPEHLCPGDHLHAVLGLAEYFCPCLFERVLVYHHLSKIPDDVVGSFSLDDRLRPLQKSPSPDNRNPKTGFRLFPSPQSLLILPKHPLNPPRTPDNQASGPPFRRQQAHLACWPLSTGSNTSPSDGFAHSL